jgi:hypothetical protein
MGPRPFVLVEVLPYREDIVINLFGAEHVIETLITGIQKAFPMSTVNSNNIKTLYQQFIHENQPAVPDPQSDEIIFVSSERDGRILANIFYCGDSELDDHGAYGEDYGPNGIILDAQQGPLPACFSELKKTNPDFSYLANLFANYIIQVKGNNVGGGSTSTAVGVIAANLPRSLPLHEGREFFVHEITHQLMFLDEWRYGHYDYNVATNKESWAISSVRNQPRPIDKVLHSMVVATEVILARQNWFGHPNRDGILHPVTSKLAAQIKRTLSTIRGNELSMRSLAPRAIVLMETVEAALSAHSV